VGRLERDAFELHRVAQRSGRRADFDRAIAAYEELRRAHPSSPHAFEILYFDGEARYAIEDWAGAADCYARALARRPYDARSVEAAYAYVLAVRRAHGFVEKDPDPACGAPAAAPILEAYDEYLGLVAESPDRPLILFAKAKMLYACGRFADAEPVLAEIVDHAASSRVAAPAAAMLLDALEQQGKRAELLARVQSLTASPLAHDPLLTETLGALRSAQAPAREP
jgi:tetratricopeptide (TPR) repeat protein